MPPRGPIEVDHDSAEKLLTRIEEELNRYISNELPIHLIHLQTAKLLNRHAVFEHIAPWFRTLPARHVPEDVVAALLHPVASSANTPAVHNFFRYRVRYAVLSDEWGNPELGYGDIPGPSLHETSPGRYNVAKFCEIARDYNIEYAWVDTCCIDRSGDAELHESIRSIYRWYANAFICVAHLENATSVGDLGTDAWFKRGWTLLQLLAPAQLKFYNRAWDPLTDDVNDKQSPPVLAEIERAISISAIELQQFDPKSPDTYQISKRMRWAANRTTMLVEDRAYSLMGVFGVTIDIHYGEGASRAFSRLFKEIVHFSNSPEAVNWVGRPAEGSNVRSRAYPPSPDAFIGSHDIPGLIRREPVVFLSTGLSIKLLVLPVTRFAWETDGSKAVLRCFDIGVQVDCLREFKPTEPGEGCTLEYAFGGWNFSTMDGRCQPAGDMIEAVLLYRVASIRGVEEKWRRIPTESFIRIEARAADPPQGRRWMHLAQTVVL